MTSAEQAQLYEAYHDKVLAYIAGRVERREDAEDLCADVFEKVFLHADSYDASKASASTWVYAIARNTVIDFHRTERRLCEVPEELAEEGAIDADLLREETLGELAQAMAALTDEQRDIIVLRYYRGKTLRDIAVTLGLTYGVTKLRHNQALETLRRAMTYRS